MDHPPPTSETEQNSGMAKKPKIDQDPKAVVTTAADSVEDFSPPPSKNGGDSNPPAKKSENEKDDERRRSEASLMLTNMATHAGMPNINIPNPGGTGVFEPEMQTRALLGSKMVAREKEEDPENAFNMSQSERKRFREKKRRQNISAAIDNLTKILLKVDPINFIEHNNQMYFATDRGSINESNDPTFRKRRSSTARAPSTSHHHQPLNRTEIITHAAMLIERLASESEETKMKLMQMQHMPNNNSEGNGAAVGAPNTNNGAPSMSMVSPFPMQQQPPQMMMVSNGMPQAAPTAILMQPPYGIPQYIVNGPAPPGWPMQQQQHMPAFIAPGGVAPNMAFVNGTAPAPVGVEAPPEATATAAPATVAATVAAITNTGPESTTEASPAVLTQTNGKEEVDKSEGEEKDNVKGEPNNPSTGDAEQAAGVVRPNEKNEAPVTLKTDLQEQEQQSPSNDKNSIASSARTEQLQQEQQSGLSTNSITAAQTEGCDNEEVSPPQSDPKDSGPGTATV